MNNGEPQYMSWHILSSGRGWSASSLRRSAADRFNMKLLLHPPFRGSGAILADANFIAVVFFCQACSCRRPCSVRRCVQIFPCRALARVSSWSPALVSIVLLPFRVFSGFRIVILFRPRLPGPIPPQSEFPKTPPVFL